MDHATEVLRARLEWLRLMGVDALRRPAAGMSAPATPASPEGAHPAAPAPVRVAVTVAPAAPQRAPSARFVPSALQGGLFGEAPPFDVPAAGRGAAAGEEPASTTAAHVGAASPLAPFLSGPAPVDRDPASALAAVRAEIGDCRRCRLSERRTTIVFGVGNPAARLVFVGEGPGADEDAQGEPFVGRAGQLLTKIIEAMGLARADVYIANVVKCRPPENRTPLPDEVATCAPFLFRQIGAIRPEVIVCLGTPAAQTLFGTRETITKIRGVFRLIEGVRVMPTFHPAYLLRNPAAKREVWEDMKQVMALLEL
jgi:uracil-DNA glycosylase